MDSGRGRWVVASLFIDDTVKITSMQHNEKPFCIADVFCF